MSKYEFGSKRVYTSSIAIKPEHLLRIDNMRGKKSKAGKLDEIIEFYIKTNKLNKQYDKRTIKRDYQN